MTDCIEPSVRVAVKHALPVISAGIVATLRSRRDIRLVSDAAASDEFAEVVVTDYDHALKEAAAHAPGKRVPRLLIVTGTDRETDVRMALHAGVTGYVLYDCAPDELLSAVIALGRGGRHFCAKVLERLADSLRHDALTPRELDVLSLMTRGFNNKLIARELRISLGTVKAHANAVYGKLNATSRLQAVAVAVARGIGTSSTVQSVRSNAAGSVARPIERETLDSRDLACA